MKRVKAIILTTSLLLTTTILFSSCRSTDSDAVKDDKKKEKYEFSKPDNDQEVIKLANTYMDELLQAMKDRNYDLFSKHLTVETKERITQAVFKQMASKIFEAYGDYESRKLLSIMHNGVFRTILWKGKFEKAHKRDKDVMMSILLAKLDGEYKVFGLGFN